MVTYMVTVRGYEHHDSESPVELIFFVKGKTSDDALAKASGLQRVRLMHRVAYIDTERM